MSDPLPLPEPSDPLRSEFGGDPEMTEMVQAFVAQLPEHVDEIERATGNKDVSALILASRMLKCAAGGYGFSSITDAALVVEQQAVSCEDIDTFRQSIDHLVSLCRRATAEPK